VARRPSLVSTVATSVGGLDPVARVRAQAHRLRGTINALQDIVDEYAKAVAKEKRRNGTSYWARLPS